MGVNAMDDEKRQGLELKNKMNIPTEAFSSKVCFIGDDYNIPLTQDVLSKHILFSGSIGSGKTTAINGVIKTIVSAMTRNDVMVVFDAKGDFKKEFYRPGIDQILSCTGDSTTIWNIFKEIELDGLANVELNLMELVNSFFDEKIRRSHSPFFPMAAKDVLYGIMMYILRKTSIADRTNEELYLYLRDASLEDVISSFSEMDDLRGLLDYIYSESGATEQSQGVYSELRTVANELLIGNFKKTGDFSIRSFVRNKGGRILFVEYDLGIGSVLTPVYKALFDLAIKETLSRKHTNGNVYFVIDEFSLLPHLYHISDGVNFGRSLGAKFIVAIQNCQQIVEAYGRQNAYSILSAFGTVVSFRNTDLSTIEFIQNHYGTARTRISYSNRDYRSGGSDSLVTGKVIEDWEILSLSRGEAIISIADYSPCPVKYKFKKV